MELIILILLIIAIALFLTKKKENIMNFVSNHAGCLVQNPSGVVRCSNDKHYKCTDPNKCYPYKCVNNYSGIVTERNEPCWHDEIYYLGLQNQYR